MTDDPVNSLGLLMTDDLVNSFGFLRIDNFIRLSLSIDLVNLLDLLMTDIFVFTNKKYAWLLAMSYWLLIVT